MSSIIKTIKKLQKEPEREYGLSEMTQEGIFPWAKDLKSIRTIIARDLNGANLLKTRIEGEGRRKRYTVKAKNIIKFLETYGPGLMIGKH